MVLTIEQTNKLIELTRACSPESPLTRPQKERICALLFRLRQAKNEERPGVVMEMELLYGQIFSNGDGCHRAASDSNFNALEGA